MTLELERPDNENKIASLDDSAYEPSLGVLTLTSVLRQTGISPQVIDLNGIIRNEYLDPNRQNEINVLEAASSAIAALDADIFGFGTICSSYPSTIRLAEKIKHLRPGAKIILGG